MSTDVAQGKTATASDYIAPFTALKAVDGTLSAASRWVSNLNDVNGSKSHWLQVNLGDNYYIGSYTLVSMAAEGWNSSYVNNYLEVSVSLDNSRWTTVDTVSGNTAPTLERTLSSGVLCRYIKINFSYGMPVNNYLNSVVEFQAFTSPYPYLSNLVPCCGSLNPAFNANTFSYTDNVDTAVSTITLTPTAADAAATITVNGVAAKSGIASQAIALDYGTTTIPVVVTDGGQSKTYTVAVTRPGGAMLSNLVPSAGSLSPAFSAGTFSYTDTVDGTVSSITLTPTAAVTAAAITVNGSAVQSGSASQAIAIGYGTTTIPVVVTNAGQANTYNVAVTKTSKYLSTLVVNDNSGTALTLSPAFDGHNTFAYTASVGYDVANVTVTPMTDEATETVTVNGTAVTSGTSSQQIPISVGSTNVIKVISTAAAGTSQEYDITVTKQSSPNLTGLVVTFGKGTTLGLTPLFSSTCHGYTASLTKSATPVSVKATAEDTNSKLTLGGVALTSGVAYSYAIGQTGTSIEIDITLNDGTIATPYIITLTRT